jgi:hypothetical protein
MIHLLWERITNGITFLPKIISTLAIRCIAEKDKYGNFKGAPIRFWTTAFMVLLFCGYLFKFMGIWTNVDSMDLGTLLVPILGLLTRLYMKDKEEVKNEIDSQNSDQ